MKIDQDCRAQLAGIAAALRDDIQAGWLESVIELAHADTYEGYLEVAEGLVSQGYKDAAAVIAGSAPEDSRRQARCGPCNVQRWPKEG